jgi:hypothetical protein
MTDDQFKDKGNDLPESSAFNLHGQPQYSARIFLIFRWLLRQLFRKKSSGKKFLKIKHTTRKPDGSGTQTEIIYQEER